MSRMKFSSREQIQECAMLVEHISSKSLLTRALATNTEFTDGDEEFRSLYEENKEKVLSNFSSEELAILNNDPDELEYELTDSIIADYRFAQLLNANREIQLKDSVYRYFDRGVAVTDEEHSEELDNIDDIVSQIDPESSRGSEIPINSNVKFIVPDWHLSDHLVTVDPLDPTVGGGGNGDLMHGPLQIAGMPTPEDISVREVDYEKGGDGNWLHKLWTGFWGKNIVALNKFDSTHQLNLNFYDQNYIIYSNIGTKIKMQKKVLGIWWNIEAEEMYHGWEMVCLDFTTPTPVYANFPKNNNGQTNFPLSMNYPTPFNPDANYLLYIPFTDITFSSSNLNKVFANALSKAWSALNNFWQSTYKKQHDNNTLGLFSFRDAHFFTFYGPTVLHGSQKKSMESKFFAKLFPGTYEFVFTLNSNGNFSIKNIKIDGDDHVCIDSGIVFGAIKYNGQWRAARIYKLHKTE